MAVILLVEDEEQVRVLAESFLQAEGNKTLSAATIEQALALIEGDEPVDLLFVDLKIQDDVEGGLKLARKAVEARANLRVLYTSGQAVTDGMKALFVERSIFLQKPYTVEQLATTLLAKFSIGSRSKKSGE
jgi:DNA-binding NtrC family response regulator